MKILIAFFRLIRIANLGIIGLSLSLFYFFIVLPNHENRLHTTLLPLTHFEFVLLVLGVMLIAAAGNIINDYFDFELDKEFKPARPLPSGIIGLDAALYLHTALALSGIAIGFYLGWKNNHLSVGYVFIICALLLYVYSASLKKIPLVGNVVIAALTGFVFVLLLIFESFFLSTIHFDEGSYLMYLLIWQACFYGGFAFLTNLARELVKDLEDREGDAAYRINTAAVQFGETTTKWIAIAVLILLLASLGYFLNILIAAHSTKEVFYLLLAVILPVLICIDLLRRATTAKDYSKISLYLKIVMLAGILSIPAFYYFSQA